MRYAQINSGNKLHLIFEAGEGFERDNLIPAGYVSAPLCHTSAYNGRYRMTINVPLAHACKNCQRVYKKRFSK